MHGLDLLIGGKAPTDAPIVVLHGDDAYLKAEALGALARALLDGDDEGLALKRFAGEKADLATVLDEVRTLPFLSRRRVVVVQEADPFVTAGRRGLEDYAAAPAASGVLILEVRTWPATTKLAKLVAQAGLAVECKSPPERDLPRHLKAFAKVKFGVRLGDEAAALLLELVGPEVGRLLAEVEKLATAVAARGEIGPEDVARNVAAGRIEKVWTILDLATTGKGGAALDQLDLLLASGEHPVGLLAALATSLRKLHHAGALRRARVELGEACRLAGIPAFRDAIDKTARQHAHLGPSRVDALPALLLRADLELKGNSSLPPRVVLERLVARLAAPRRD